MVPFGRTAAVFDVDDSLLDGNAGTIFTWYLYRQKVMRPEIRARIPRVIYEYARGRLTEQDMVEVGSSCHVGLRADELKVHAHACFERHLRKRITSRRRSGRSAATCSPATSCSWPPARPSTSSTSWPPTCGVHAAIGTRTSIVDGRFTDQILRPVVFREGKREAVEQLWSAGTSTWPAPGSTPTRRPTCRSSRRSATRWWSTPRPPSARRPSGAAGRWSGGPTGASPASTARAKTSGAAGTARRLSTRRPAAAPAARTAAARSPLVRAATSSSATPQHLGHLLRHQPTWAGSFRLPRNGMGARNGESVSTSSRSSGTRRTASRIASAVLKVTMPATET